MTSTVSDVDHQYPTCRRTLGQHFTYSVSGSGHLLAAWCDVSLMPVYRGTPCTDVWIVWMALRRMATLACLVPASCLYYQPVYCCYCSLLRPATGYSRSGYHKDGYKKDGYDAYGYDKYGYGKEGVSSLLQGRSLPFICDPCRKAYAFWDAGLCLSCLPLQPHQEQ
jgi:hypothetical protein